MDAVNLVLNLERRRRMLAAIAVIYLQPEVCYRPHVGGPPPRHHPRDAASHAPPPAVLLPILERNSSRAGRRAQLNTEGAQLNMERNSSRAGRRAQLNTEETQLNMERNSSRVGRRAQLNTELQPQKRRRRWWVRPINQRRAQHGVSNHLIQELRLDDVESHYAFFRMCREHFEKLLTLVGPRIEKQTTNYRQPISSVQRLAITLRFLATGETYSSIALTFRYGKATVAKIVIETAVALWDVLWPTYMPVPNRNMWQRISCDFWEKWQFPMCVGAMDGKHIYIQAPPNRGSRFNYKESHSIVLLALCDADYKYTIVDIGAYGKQSDSGVFGESSFGRALAAGTVDLPPASNIPGTSVTVPPVIVADEAFPLLRNLMRPFPRKNITAAQTIFNKRLSRARRVSENVFGITCAKWRTLLDCLHVGPDSAEVIVKCICALHNYVTVEESSMAPEIRTYCPDGYMDREDENGNVLSGQWRQEVGEVSVTGLCQQDTNNFSKTADQIRETYVNYFSASEGNAYFVEHASDIYSGF